MESWTADLKHTAKQVTNPLPHTEREREREKEGGRKGKRECAHLTEREREEREREARRERSSPLSRLMRNAGSYLVVSRRMYCSAFCLV